ncbi:hypothetical protein BS17DRAFT_819827 [Gyrodon lividus]|nr:hypothetical protein BS17DRAFT_819827 [Gyrodon lividus]
MVNHARSNAAKKLEKRRSNDKKMGEALEVYSAEQMKPETEQRGLRPIAMQFGVSFKSLSRRYHHKQSISEFNTTKQKLTVAEERVIIDFTARSADRGIPLTHQLLQNSANEILRAHLGSDTEPVGINWSQRFLTRHREEL